jgi:hypothetical protein
MLKNPEILRKNGFLISYSTFGIEHSALILPSNHKIKDINVSLDYNLFQWHHHNERKEPPAGCFYQLTQFQDLKKTHKLKKPIETFL